MDANICGKCIRQFRSENEDKRLRSTISSSFFINMNDFLMGDISTIGKECNTSTFKVHYSEIALVSKSQHSF